MRGALTRRVDPWQAALAGVRVTGTLDAARLPRLSEVAQPQGLLQVSLDFAPQPAGAARKESGVRRPGVVRVALHVSGTLRSTCQRCLEPVDLDATLDTVVSVTGTEADAGGEGLADAVLVDAGELLDPALLVEDELLLALPFAPAHDEGECMAEVPAGDMPAEEPAPPEPRERADNPFAVLGALRDRSRDDN